MNTPRFPGHAGYTKSRCCAGAPRLPTSGSQLSLLILVSMLPSSTTENSPVAYTQFLHWRRSLHLHATDSAFSCIPPQSATGGEKFSRLTVRILLRPADLLASLTDPTLLALCRLRLLLRSFRSEKSLSLPSGMTTVATGQVLLAGPTPAGLAASFAALHVVSQRARVLRLRRTDSPLAFSVAAVLPSSYSE